MRSSCASACVGTTQAKIYEDTTKAVNELTQQLKFRYNTIFPHLAVRNTASKYICLNNDLIKTNQNFQRTGRVIFMTTYDQQNY